MRHDDIRLRRQPPLALRAQARYVTKRRRSSAHRPIYVDAGGVRVCLERMVRLWLHTSGIFDDKHEVIVRAFGRAEWLAEPEPVPESQ